MQVNKNLITELRQLTAAGLNDCKIALEETQNDLDRAVDIIKARGLNNASKNASKVAAEGRIIISFDHAQDATMVEVNVQTEFCARSEEFITFCNTVAFAMSEADLAAFSGDLATLPVVIYDDKGVKIDDKATLESLRQDLMVSTKENIVVRRWFVEEVFGNNRRVFDYTHSNSKLGVLVSLEAPDGAAIASPEFEEFGYNVAMQIAAMNPLAVSMDQIPQEEKDRQKAIFETQLKEAGKPEASWEKILLGKFKKWQSDVCLLDQEAVFLSDGSKKSIKVLADELAAKLGGAAGTVKILNFTRCQVGEGIEKPKEEDYAQEIGKMAGFAEIMPKSLVRELGKMTGLSEEVARDNGAVATIHTALTNGVDVVKESN